MQHFLSFADLAPDEVLPLLDRAAALKRGASSNALEGKTVVVLFEKPSLRTKLSFWAGVQLLGGNPVYFGPEEVGLGKREPVPDVARVVSRMADVAVIRTFAHARLEEFAAAATIPVVNALSDGEHPCQALADILTVYEKFGTFEGVKFVMSWAYSPSVYKPRAVPQSAIIGASMMGMDVVLAHPKGMELDEEVLQACEGYAERYGGSFEISNSMDAAFDGAHVVYPKSWTAVPTFKPPVGEDDPQKAQGIFDANKDWICDADKMALADPDAIYMHCLPCDRGFEVTDEVMDGPQSVAFDEAENRLHVQKAVMALTMK